VVNHGQLPPAVIFPALTKVWARREKFHASERTVESGSIFPANKRKDHSVLLTSRDHSTVWWCLLNETNANSQESSVFRMWILKPRCRRGADKGQTRNPKTRLGTTDKKTWSFSNSNGENSLPIPGNALAEYTLGAKSPAKRIIKSRRQAQVFQGEMMFTFRLGLDLANSQNRQSFRSGRPMGRAPDSTGGEDAAGLPEVCLRLAAIIASRVEIACFARHTTRSLECDCSFNPRSYDPPFPDQDSKKIEQYLNKGGTGLFALLHSTRSASRPVGIE